MKDFEKMYSAFLLSHEETDHLRKLSSAHFPQGAQPFDLKVDTEISESKGTEANKQDTKHA